VNQAFFVPLFYFGTLISSVGTFAFNLSLIAFMLKSGFHLGEASLIIGLQRFIPVLIMGLWGQYTDKWSPKATVAVAETIAALTSMALIFIWIGSETNYFLLASVCILRSVVVSIQVGSRSKITKLLSQESYQHNSKHAIWLNKATQGATLFGGVLGWLIILHFSLETAIYFDAFTFLLNGLIILWLPQIQNQESEKPTLSNWKQKFTEYFSFNKRAALLDIFLAFSMMGTMAYISRIAGKDQSWAGIFMGSYGLAVWVAGYLERGFTSKYSTIPYWLLLGLSFFTLGRFSEPGFMVLGVLFIRDLCYWIIFHRISSYIQVDTPASKMGSISSARLSIMITILALGEILVGSGSSYVSVSEESTLRACIGFALGGYLWFTAQGRSRVYDRPTL